MRTLSTEAVKKVGQTIIVKGWVQARRDHGGLIFIDLRDHSGILQLVIHPDQKESFKVAESLRDEFVIEASGTIRQRDKDLVNPKLETGKVELAVHELKLINKSLPLPIDIHGDALSNEELRYKYRYIDLRRPKVQETLKKRAKYYKFIRDYMEANDFLEISTPILANSSPEGARDFLIPSRVHPGKFYALPQAPQMFKQLLMVGGVNRYYQIATCFRDEDPRADRLYGDFYQLDLEMSFVDDGEVVRSTMEPLVKSLITDFANKKLLGNHIPRITFAEAMDKYGTDKPDLRFAMELIDLSSELKSSPFSVFSSAIKDGGVVKAIKVAKGADFSRSEIDKLTEIARSEGAKGLAYILIKDHKVESPIAKFLADHEIKAIKEKTEAKDSDAIFFVADSKLVANKVLGHLRNVIADWQGLKDRDVVAAVWVVDFPFYEWDETKKKLDFGHNPFSLPKGGMKALESEDQAGIVADQYDIVLNGYECCSGAVRNYSPEIMYKAFANLGYDKKYVDKCFGAMTNAFKYGAPPHAGCAFGLDRIFMVLTNEDNIREIVAFPKNGSGIDTMMNSPSEIDPDRMKELNIRVV